MQPLTGQLLIPFKYFQGEKTFAAMAEMQERCSHQQNAPGMQGVCSWAGLIWKAFLVWFRRVDVVSSPIKSGVGICWNRSFATCHARISFKDVTRCAVAQGHDDHDGMTQREWKSSTCS